MSIASEITRLQNAKASIKTSIEAKGVTVPSSAKLDDYDTYVDAIQTGGGTSKIASVLEGTVTTMSASDFDGATTLRGSAFENCNSLTSVIMPNTITTLSENGYQFQNCVGLTSVSVSSNLTKLPIYCFTGCTSLTSVDLKNVSLLETNVFNRCTSLTSINLSNVTKMSGGTGQQAGVFYGCTSLTSSGLTLPTTFSSELLFGQNTFQGCTGLTSFTYPTYTGSTGFSINCLKGCYNITTLDISNVPSGKILSMPLELGTSSKPSQLTTVIGMPTTCGTGFYNGSGKMFQYCSYLTTITLPTPTSSTTTCAAALFEHSGLTTITTPNNLKTLGNYMFNDCQSLTSVTISADVNKINQNCFSSCPLLTEITYLGTMADWGSITFGTNWKQNTPLTTVHCSDGDITL